MTMHAPETPSTQLPDFYTVPDLAKYLRVSTATVYRYVRDRSIAFVSLPRGLRFNKAAVDEFVARQSVPCMQDTYERTKT